jgi:hypothetical protein
LADSGPTVSRRIRHSTGSKNLNVSIGVETDINAWTSVGTGNSTVCIVMLVNMEACTYIDGTNLIIQMIIYIINQMSIYMINQMMN